MNKQSGFIAGLGLQGYFIIAAVVAMLAGAGYLKYQFNSLKSENASLATDNKTLKDANATLVTVNEQNVIVIDKMKKDKEASDKLSSDFRIQKARDNAELNNLRASIKKIIESDPSADGIASPVLKQTIQDLINARTPAQGVKK